MLETMDNKNSSNDKAIDAMIKIKAVLDSFEDDWTKFDKINSIVDEYNGK